VEASRLGDRARGKLMSLLSDDHPDPGLWVGRLRSLSDLENTPVFASAVRFLFHLKVDDAEAELLLERVLDHRGLLSRELGRDPGLRVAAMDYLSNIERRFENPKIVEMDEFEETERSARTDALTGLANRRVFHETLDAEIRRSRRYRWPVTVLMLDLDHFKDVNDSFGHMFGDLVLERVGGIVRHAVRDADAACRFGGEELAVVLPETAREGGYAVAERIRRRVEKAFQGRPVDGQDIAMTISAGLATFPEDGLHADELLARADEALYGAKHAGRNRVCVHFREKRAALRFPVKPGTAVRLGSATGVGAKAVNLSRTGVLLDAGTGLFVTDRVRLNFERCGGAGIEEAFELSGRVARVVADPAHPAHAQVGIAFDDPIPESQFAARVSLSRVGARGPRGTVR
jgi:diguanylate cyclase (GGDEF)-like protein